MSSVYYENAFEYKKDLHSYHFPISLDENDPIRKELETEFSELIQAEKRKREQDSTQSSFWKTD